MHLLVSIVVLFIPLTGGYSLECYACEPGQYCQYSTRTCYDKCRSTKTVDYFEPSSQQSLATKGCASKSACDQEPGEILGLNGNITCCEGNLCNVAQSGTQSFLFLCCSLLSFILLH
ncbi:hypothetical protein Q8A67_022201 [Cirrhinus molitorella]|uniref:UPAR/Ly6 domain-containing protein n=1 Tax=Cirrhinus molitorella TaxID=172907 RepID=A0AA88P7J8_9TELE|nr:hypothetical protein Q8A67_022201 [Cirrhinus molitorella]